MGAVKIFMSLKDVLLILYLCLHKSQVGEVLHKSCIAQVISRGGIVSPGSQFQFVGCGHEV